MDKKDMLEQIMAFDFSLIDLGLYLDTHSNDAEAIRMHKEYKEESDKLRKEYEMQHGPLTPGTTSETTWNWIDDPWPWEKMFM